jgi:hypothetical protein
VARLHHGSVTPFSLKIRRQAMSSDCQPSAFPQIGEIAIKYPFTFTARLTTRGEYHRAHDLAIGIPWNRLKARNLERSGWCMCPLASTARSAGMNRARGTALRLTLAGRLTRYGHQSRGTGCYHQSAAVKESSAKTPDHRDIQ